MYARQRFEGLNAARHTLDMLIFCYQTSTQIYIQLSISLNPAISIFQTSEAFASESEWADGRVGLSLIT